MKQALQQIVSGLRTMAAHPKTTATGLAAIAGATATALHDHSQLSNPAMWVGLLTGVGLLFAGDGQPPAQQ